MRTLHSEHSNIYFGENIFEELNIFLSEKNYSSLFVLVDENTKKYCFPILKKNISLIRKAKTILIRSGEKNKNIKTCISIWDELLKQGADRNSLLINLGGGAVSDIGGFCASTYKRGIDCINIPTTLLAQADASIGGKTGIDFANYKNQIGRFAFPGCIFIYRPFLKTLNSRQLLSGFAEMFKMGLIADKNYYQSLVTLTNQNDFIEMTCPEEIIFRSAELKNEIVSKDPLEKGFRKILNFGHTVGHAIETAFFKTTRPLLHGEAVAIGMICETYLSHKCCGLPEEKIKNIISHLSSVFKPKPIKGSVKNLISKMQKDKKNRHNEISFTLLSAIGKAEINIACQEKIIKESISFFNSL